MITDQKIVIHSKSGYNPKLDELVNEMIQANVKFVAVFGKDAQKIEDVIDELCVGDGSSPYFMVTTSHPNESLEEAIEFAQIQSFQGTVQIIEF